MERNLCTRAEAITKTCELYSNWEQYSLTASLHAALDVCSLAHNVASEGMEPAICLEMPYSSLIHCFLGLPFRRGPWAGSNSIELSLKTTCLKTTGQEQLYGLMSCTAFPSVSQAPCPRLLTCGLMIMHLVLHGGRQSRNTAPN